MRRRGEVYLHFWMGFVVRVEEVEGGSSIQVMFFGYSSTFWSIFLTNPKV